MNDFEEKPSLTFSRDCCICLSKSQLTYLTKDNNLFNVFILIAALKAKEYDSNCMIVCTTCIQELDVISDFINTIKERYNWSENDEMCCTACSSKENLSLPPQNLLTVFKGIINTYKLVKSHHVILCNECLDKLQDILEFATKFEKNYKNISQNVIMKQEPLKICLKEEPPDDEFVEIPTKIKTEPYMFSCGDLEINSNYIVKTEAVEEIDCNLEDYKDSIKIEVEEEGVQYDCKELMIIDCSFCKKIFTNTRGLLNHMKQKYRCRYNRPKSTNTWRKFLQRIRKPFKCQVCLRYFSTIQKKKQHRKNHFGKSCVACPFCGKLFIKEREYLEHSTVHLTKLLLECRLCPRTFTAECLLLKHLQKHKIKSSKCYKCGICSVSFSKKLLHEIHVNREKIPCPYCPKQNCSKSQLSIHLRSHTRRRPFECAVCTRKFSHKGNLTKHSRTHTGFKPYSCNTCLKSFARPDYLNKHYLTIHGIMGECQYYTKRKKRAQTIYKEKVKEAICNICSKNYPSKQSLSAHMRVHNKEKNFQCKVCLKKFLYKGILSGHMKIHLDYKPFGCTLCPKRFIKRNDLTRHTYTHTKEKNYKCEICHDKFSRKDVLRLHLRSHTGQRPYECHNCLKTFAQKSNLTHHYKRCNQFFKVEFD